ncbi:MAG: sensor histidine kinase, partial [Bacteroidia bacterium]
RDIESSLPGTINNEPVQILTDFNVVNKIISVKSYVHSIFYNLISNSIKYRQPDQTLVIAIKSFVNKEKIMISFKDNGIGIDLIKHGDKIFSLYSRFHLNIEGKGMGLFMIKTEAESLGGNITVKSKPGEGAEFIVELPF